MRWVNDTLPPRPRRRWLLMTTRLSISSLAGMARTLVAVGTARLASMLVTMRAAAPRRGDVPPSEVAAGLGAAACPGFPGCSALAPAAPGDGSGRDAVFGSAGARRCFSAGAGESIVVGAVAVGAFVSVAGARP